MDRTEEFRSQKSAAVADPSMMGSYGEPGNTEYRINAKKRGTRRLAEA